MLASYFQLTRGGAWDTAVRLPAPAASREIVTLLEGDPPDASVDTAAPAGEVFFGAPPGTRLFAGARDPRPGGAATVAERIQRCAELGQRAPGALLVHARETAPTPWFTRPAFAELGVVDRWSSEATVRVPLAIPLGASASLIGALASGATVVRHPQCSPALEIAFTEPVDHWIGVEVGRREGAEWVVDTDRLRRVWAELVRMR